MGAGFCALANTPPTASRPHATKHFAEKLFKIMQF
jgi:hypothetical protein